MPKRWSAALGILLVLATCVALAAVAFPHLASAYHLEAGGQAAQDGETCVGASSLALEHLHKAIEWEPSNAEAYRLLAGVYRSHGSWPAAVEAQERYTELRPGSPLGYIELAEIYEQIEAQIEAMDRNDLIDLLPQAEVAVPDAPIETPYGGPDKPGWQYYVAEATFSLPPHYGDRPTLFMHSPSWVTFTLPLPPQPTLLRFDMGMDPEVHDWPGDGATFEVFVNGDRVFLEHLDKAMAHQGWHGRTVDLEPWVGQVVALTLAITPGPVVDTVGDWAGWGEPEVVDARLPGLEALHPGPQLLETWRRAGLTAETLLRLGEAARQDQEYDKARNWYERAMRLAPNLADPWFFLGLLYEDQEQWHQALAAYEQALTLDDYRSVGRSSPLFRMGQIHQRRLDPPLLEDALVVYKAALKANEFDTQADAAWAHARLGQVYYLVGKRAAVAESEILQALELAPKDKWLYVALGDLYRDQGQKTEAEAAYRHALELAPEFEAALERLDALIVGP